MLYGKHLFTSSNCIHVAHQFAISEGILYPSDSGFSRTDVPSSHYTGAPFPFLLCFGPYFITSHLDAIALQVNSIITDVRYQV